MLFSHLKEDQKRKQMHCLNHARVLCKPDQPNPSIALGRTAPYEWQEQQTYPQARSNKFDYKNRRNHCTSEIKFDEEIPQFIHDIYWFWTHLQIYSVIF